MRITLTQLAHDIADALAAVDATRPVHKSFQPGIGPFGESEAVRAALTWLKANRTEKYSKAVIKRLPDLLVPGEWAVEFKIIRPFGDNGKAAEHWSENVLHPYAGNTSSLGDCTKLADCNLSEQKAVVIIGYEHTPPLVELEAAIASFELIGREVTMVQLSQRVEELRSGLVHPVHQQFRVHGYEVLGLRSGSIAAGSVPASRSGVGTDH
jgi:hypothetical protein